MPSRTIIVGHGMTAREETPVDEGNAEVLPEFSESCNAAFRTGGGVFGAVSLDAEQICRRVLDEAGVRPFAPDSPADLASRFLDLHRISKAFAGRGDTDRAMMCAFLAGQHFARSDAKWAWEKHAMAGRKQAANLAEIRMRQNRSVKSAREADWRRWNDEAAHVWKDKPTLSKSAVARAVKKRLALPEAVDTISRKLQKVRTAR